MPSGYCKVRGCDKLGKGDQGKVYWIPRAPTTSKKLTSPCQDVRSRRRNAWLKALGFKPDDSSPEIDKFVVCSKHFVYGKPALMKEVNDVDWVPTLNLNLEDCTSSRNLDVVDLTVDSADEELEDSSVDVNLLKRKKQSEFAEPNSLESELFRETPLMQRKLPRLKPSPLLSNGFRNDSKLDTELALSHLVGDQSGSHEEQSTRIKCESSLSSPVEEENANDVIQRLKYENERLLLQNQSLKAKLLEKETNYISLVNDHKISMSKFADLRYLVDRYTISEKTFVADEEIVKYFTGLPTFDVLKAMYSHIETYMDASQCPISKFQQYILTLMCMRLNIGFDLLSHIFRLPVNLVSKLFSRVLQVMFARYSALVSWPLRENLFPSVPLLYRETFGQQIVVIIDTLELAVVIDSIEVVMDGASEQGPSPATLVSNYRNKTCVKFLIAMSPQGAVLSISRSCRSNLSEKELLESSGILQNLLPGDIIIGQRGGSVHEVVEQKMNGNAMQVQPYEMNNRQDTSKLKIHVERVIDIFKKSFKFWSSGLRVEFFNVSNDGPPAVDKMILVCCALNNASLTVVL